MLTQPQQTTLRALLDRIIPRGSSPGALDAGVETYILHQLAHDLAPQRELYETGLTSLDNTAQLQHRMLFSALPVADQEALMTTIEAESGSELAYFLRVVSEHAAEGFYTSPIGWQMVGFEITDPERMTR